MKTTHSLITSLRSEGVLSRAALRVGRGDRILGEVYAGADSRALFDMASVTKILVTTPLVLMAADEGKLALDDPVGRFFPVPEHNRALTVRHLLTHTTGVGHRDLTAPGITQDTVAAHILALRGGPIGERVDYSCPAFILLGKLLESIYARPLDVLFAEKIAAPLGMANSRFCPEGAAVDDYNCRHLGGVAGNAGLFSCVEDVAAFIRCLLGGGAPLIAPATLDEACRCQTAGKGEARGLGFLFVDENYAQTGDLFPVGSVGHCGHTGTSVFLDRQSGLYAILLTDATRTLQKTLGREDYGAVKDMRRRIHNAIRADLAKE